MLAVAAASGLSAKIVLGFVDGEVNRLLDLDARHEVSLCLVPIGHRSEISLPATSMVMARRIFCGLRDRLGPLDAAHPSIVGSKTSDVGHPSKLLLLGRGFSLSWRPDDSPALANTLPR